MAKKKTVTRNIFSGTEPAVEITINIDDQTFLELSKIAHQRDITFNQLIVDILTEQIDKDEKAKNH